MISRTKHRRVDCEKAVQAKGQHVIVVPSMTPAVVWPPFNAITDPRKKLVQSGWSIERAATITGMEQTAVISIVDRNRVDGRGRAARTTTADDVSSLSGAFGSQLWPQTIRTCGQHGVPTIEAKRHAIRSGTLIPCHYSWHLACTTTRKQAYASKDTILSGVV